MDKKALLSYTGMTAADVELVYEPCRGQAARPRSTAAPSKRQHAHAHLPQPTRHHTALAPPKACLQRASSPVRSQRALLARHAAARRGHPQRHNLRPLRPTARPDAPTSVFFANVKIIVDSTFVPLPKNTFVRQDYHQKSPTKAAWKYEIACDFSHRIISCSHGFHGGQHDMRIIRESGLLDQSSPTALIMGDKGYQGKLGIVVPAAKRAR